MKELLILSGKGGTGKTTIASAFIKLSDAKRFADCDVDAPNLHLVMGRDTTPKKDDFYGLDKAHIDSDKCINCGLCEKHCNFDAIYYNKKEDTFTVDYFACEGCSVCEFVCPVEAIEMQPAIVGDLMLYLNESVFSTAKLRMGSGNSGLLVTEVKNRMKLKDFVSDLAIIDGSPGIGCPVIASITGVDMVLVVAEPSVSGISDLERVIKTADHFKTPVAVCVNKYDVNEKNTEKIVKLCIDRDIPFVGKIPFDKEAIKATNKGLTIVDIECISGEKTKEVYKNTINYLNNI
jgi:MinD superfamily P-loop ATPase